MDSYQLLRLVAQCRLMHRWLWVSINLCEQTGPDKHMSRYMILQRSCLVALPFVLKKEQKDNLCEWSPHAEENHRGSLSFRRLLWENNTSLHRQMNKPSVERKPSNLCSNKHFLCSKIYFGRFVNLTNKGTKYFELPSALLYIALWTASDVFGNLSCLTVFIWYK